MKTLPLLLLMTCLGSTGLPAQPDGESARTPVAQSDVPLSEEQLREVARLRTKSLARQRRHIMNCDSGHLGKYPDKLNPGDPVDHEKLLS